MIDKLRHQLDALLNDLRATDRRKPRLRVNELERRDVPAPLTTNNVLNVYLDQTTSQFGEVGQIDNGLSEINPFSSSEVQNFGNASSVPPFTKFGPGGVATLNGDVYIFDTQPGSVDSVGNPTDDASALYRLDPETGAVAILTTFGRESGGLSRTADGMLLNVWYDGVYASNPLGFPASATVGISKIDPVTGAETILFQRPAIVPVTSADPPALKPNGVVEFNGEVFYADTRVGRTGASNGPAPVNDLTVIRRVSLSTATESDVGTYARESRGLSVTTDGQLVNGSFDGLFGTSPFGTPDAANNLLTLIDTATGVEELLESFPVPNLPYSGNPYGSAGIPPIQKIDGVAVDVSQQGVLPIDNVVYFTLTSPVRRDNFDQGFVPGVDDSTELYVRNAFGSAFLLSTFNRQSLGLAIVPVNSAPVNQPDFYSTPINQTLTVPPAGVLANDFDPDANPISAILVDPPDVAQGTVSLASDGSFVFTPAVNFFGTSTFTYSVTDGQSSSEPVTVTVFVTNQAPVASPDTYSTPAGQGFSVPASAGVLANDTDSDGPLPLTAELLSQPPPGLLSLDPDGSFVFNPPAEFVGQLVFQYLTRDAAGLASQPSTLTINVTNTVPVATDDNYSISSNNTLTVPSKGVLVNDFDPDTVGPDGMPGTPDDLPGSLFAVLVTPPDAATGSVSLASDGSFAFTPAANFVGTATFTYQASDGFGLSNLATVTISVTSQPPILTDDNYSTLVGQTLTISAPGLLANDIGNPDGTLQVTSFTQPSPAGAVSVNPDGSFTFTPAVGFVGDATFQYSATDGTTPSDQPATVTITVTSPSSGPLAVDDNYSTPAGQTLTVPAPGVIANDSNPSGFSLTTSLLSQPPATQGALTFNSDGSFEFVPNPAFTGQATFMYLLSSDFGSPTSATVTVNVTNTAPVAQPDNFSVAINQALFIDPPGVLANDTDAEGNGPLIVELVSGLAAGKGTLILDPEGSFDYFPGLPGVATFSYRVRDAAGAVSEPVVVSITVVNQPPVAVDDAFNTPAGQPLTGSVTTNDFDPDGSGPFPAQLVAAMPASEGTVTLNPYGTFTFTPAAGFVGQTSFTYRIFDSVNAPSNVATATISVTNNPPLALPDAFSTPAGKALTIAAPGLLGNDSDPDGNSLTAVLSVPPTATQGTVVVNPNGSFTFTPVAGFAGTATFQYVANDGFVNSSPATVTIIVAPPPPPTPPVGAGDSFTLPAGKSLTVAAPGVLANDSDPSGLPLTAVLGTGVPANQGTLVFNADGSFTFTPTVGFVGTASFSYRPSNGSVTGELQTVTLTVTNTAPIPQPDSFTTVAGQTLTIPAPGVLANDADVDGNTLTAVLVANSAVGGTVNLNADGSFTFAPAAGFVGTASFAYRPSDGTTTGNAVTVSVLVAPAPTGRTTLYAVGAGAGGGPRVKVFDAETDQLRFDFFVYEPTFDGGVRVAVGDVTGDGVDDVIVGSGTGGGPRVVVFDGSSGDRIADFFAYEASFRGGVHVAAGDLNGDGIAEVITGAGSTGNARVRSFAGQTFAPQLSFFAFPQDAFGGVRVAAGDLDGDGRAEIVAAEGLSGDGEVAVFSATGTETDRFAAFPGYRGGLFVAVGGGRVIASRDSVIDYQGSVFDFLIPGLGSDEVAGTPEVRVFNYRGATPRFPLATFTPYDAGYRGGVRISASDAPTDDPNVSFTLTTAPGEFGGSDVRRFHFEVFTATGGVGSVPGVGQRFTEIGALTAFESTFLGGVFVGSSSGPFDLDV